MDKQELENNRDLISKCLVQLDTNVKGLARTSRVELTRLYRVRAGRVLLRSDEKRVLEDILLGASYEACKPISVKQWLRYYRREKSLSKTDMASLLGISYPQYGAMDRGEIPLSVKQLRNMIIRLRLSKKEANILKELYFKERDVPGGVDNGTGDFSEIKKNEHGVFRVSQA